MIILMILLTLLKDIGDYWDKNHNLEIYECQFIIQFLQNILEVFYNDLKISFRIHLVSNICKITLE